MRRTKMPNWCENQVRIEGPVEKIYNMAKAVEEERLLQHNGSIRRMDLW